MEFLYSLALLACPLGMVLMVWFMAKGMKGDSHKKVASAEELRAEQRRIAEQLDVIERKQAARGGELTAP